MYLNGGPATITNAGPRRPPHQGPSSRAAARPPTSIIADPLSCTWDLAFHQQCAAGQTSTSDDYCLTADQVTTLRRIYAGPTDEHGQLLCPGYQLRGSELNWAGIITPAAATGAGGDISFVRETLRYQVFDSPQSRP
ncbi:tannase/feruloyl esterase family alpha/beta hydrolase [Streptomyces sp. L7]